MTAPGPPLLAVTMGDPAGVGPEVILGALACRKARAACRPLIVGDARCLRRAAELTGRRFSMVVVKGGGDLSGRSSRPLLLDLGNANPDKIPLGQVSAAGGRAAAECVTRAVELARAGAVAGVVTAPIHKQALRLAGAPYAGHTEMLSALCGGCEVAMMLVHGNMRVSHVSSHAPLREACDQVKRDRVLTVIRLTDQALRKIPGLGPLAPAEVGRAEPRVLPMGDEVAGRRQVARSPGPPPRSLCDRGAPALPAPPKAGPCPPPPPRIAVAGLNPHAGEAGLFGDEEEREIAPAVADARAQGIDAVGPLPPDTVFARHRAGEFDAVVAMFHDQGHIAVKTVGFARTSRGGGRMGAAGVNLTLGLPIIRTSVDHGTAFEIAGKGIADPTSMVEAMVLAAKMAAG